MGDIFRSEIDMVAGKCGADKRGASRKALADVSNTQQNAWPSNAELKPQLVPISARDIDRLTKENEALKRENLALKKQLAEHNKITELSATELQTLRVNLQSLYQQNFQLAQANSQLLAELNSGKDRLKELRHELGCMKGVLNARTLELQDKKKVVDCQQKCSKVPTIKPEEAEESLQAENATTKCTNTNKRRQSKATGKSVAKDMTDKEKSNNKSSIFAAKDTTDKEKSENKRLCVRRQSSRFKSNDPAPAEDLFELEDIKLPMYPQADDTKSGDVTVPVTLSSNKKDATGRNSTGSIATEMRRMSTGRPSRRAAEKVQSYKETPINVKMRRVD